MKRAKKPVQIAQTVKELRLDLGSGQNPKEGFEGVDLNAPKVHHRVDLFKFPWPFKDNSVSAVHCSHFIEHVPLRDVEERDMRKEATVLERERIVGKDMLFAFFDEMWRIMKPEAEAMLIWPALRSNRAFMDPTHRRFIPHEILFYLDPGWRKQNGLDHYRVDCHFIGNVNWTVPIEEQGKHAEVQAMRFSNYWNTIHDFHATMRAKK